MEYFDTLMWFAVALMAAGVLLFVANTWLCGLGGMSAILGASFVMFALACGFLAMVLNTVAGRMTTDIAWVLAGGNFVVGAAVVVGSRLNPISPAQPRS